MSQDVALSAPPLPDQSTIMEELRELHSGMLVRFVALVCVLAWAWLLVVGTLSSDPLPQSAPTLIAVAGGLVTLTLRHRAYKWACRILVVSSILALSSLVAAHPELMFARYLGIIAVIIATSLLGLLEGAVAAVFTWGAITFAAQGMVSIQILTHVQEYSVLLIYLTALSLSATAQGMLDTTVRWSLGGWTRARESLEEVRSRRQELYRALRALEEATYRIERMNTELIVARRDAEVAQAQKARFAATVSHELRGPLNIILGFGRMMALHPERYGDHLTQNYMMDVDSVYRNTQHLAALVDDVLDLAQIDADRIPLVKDRIDLKRDVIDKAIEIIKPLVDGKGLALRLDLQQDLPWLLADQVRIRQVLLNLLSNAVRHTESGSITVRAITQQDAVVVSVADTGDGIAPERQSELFLPFHQLRPEQRTGIKSSGLGLSICKQLIELHGGRIWLDSQVGEGATFGFSIPLPGTSPVGLISTIESLDSDQEQQHRICLIVHPDQDIIRLLARHVDGYRMVGVLDDGDLMTLVERLHPRAILVGLSQASHVRERVEASPYDVPIVACGFASSEHPTKGVRSHLIKPISGEMVGAVMRTINNGYSNHVLVVDDNPDEARLIERYLTDLPRPYTVAKAYNGEQALDSMARTRPDVVFMDVVMPEIDGLETVRIMQDQQALRDIPVVMVSARDWIEEQADIHMPLTVYQQRGMSMAQMARTLSVLLDSLQPEYLADQC